MADQDRDWTVLEMLEWATDYFSERDIDSPRLSVEWLLCHVLGVKRLDLYLQFDRPLTLEERDLLRPLVRRRANHEPLQYITGSTDFYHVKIKVSPDVLIPRPETEQLTEIILNDYPLASRLKIIDAGTGSGCIPTAIKKERPGWDVFAMDLSQKALGIASENAELNQVSIQLLHQDFTQPWPVFLQDADIVVSNPPYVLESEKASLHKQVRDFEPTLALYTGSLRKTYGPLILEAHKNLKQGGVLYLEIHESGQEEIMQELNPAKWGAQLLYDYGGKPRFIKAKKLDV